MPFTKLYFRVFHLWYGNTFLFLLSTVVVFALSTEIICSMIFLNNKRSFLYGSALVTALLLLCTLSLFTPWYVAVCGLFCAIHIGNIVWGRLSKNRLITALVGREFMSVFFAAVITSPNLWKSQHLVHISSSDLFSPARLDFLLEYLSSLFSKT